MTNRYFLFRARVRNKLAAIAATAPTTPPWYEAFQRLSYQSPVTEQLLVCQAIRDDGRLPPEAGFFLVASMAEIFSVPLDDAELLALPRNLRVLTAARKRAANEFQTSDDEAIESRELQEQLEWYCDWNGFVETLIAAGEHDMAKLHEENQDEFQRLWNRGCEFFYGKPPAPVEDVDEWLDALVKRISDLAVWDQPTDGFEICEFWEEDFWRIEAYVKPIEIVGGANDGAEIEPGFQLDILGLMGLFQEVDKACWDAPYARQVHIEGRYQGQNVFLIVVSVPYEE